MNKVVKPTTLGTIPATRELIHSKNTRDAVYVQNYTSAKFCAELHKTPAGFLEVGISTIPEKNKDKSKILKFNEENVRKEFEEAMGIGAGKVTLNSMWSVLYFEVEPEGENFEYEEYIVLKNEDDAIELAEQRVWGDLEDSPELFNKTWLEGMMNDALYGQSFIEHASEEAVSTDGFAHFLASYDGDYTETESGFIIMRVN